MMLTPSAAAAPVCADPGVAAAAAAVPGADDISRFAVELRERHLEYWTPYSETRLREHNSKRYLSPMVRSSYQKGSGHSFALHPSQINVSQPALCHP